MDNFYTDTISTDPRFTSVNRIADPMLLEPITRAAVYAIIASASQQGLNLIVFETYRSQQRQSALFAQKATQLQTVGVHHYGLACDLVCLVNDEPSWKPDYSFLGPLAEANNLIWGGDWGTPGIRHSFVDMDHVQRCTVAQQDALFASTWYPDTGYDPYTPVVA
jgi:hypothetical protein